MCGCWRGITQSHRDIALPAFVADPPDGAAFETTHKRCFVPCKKFEQRRSVELMSGCEVGIALGRESVPGANQLAVVTAVDAVAHGFAEFDGNAALMLDGQVADAATGVDPVGCHNN